jgi:8-oxo-dGTP pyrophosphatase MutT (NUDIX family)
MNSDPASALLASHDPRLAPSARLADARATIAAVEISDPVVVSYRTRMLTFVDAHPDALHRSCTDGHLTGSALVVDPTEERILLLLHAKVKRWLQPGGHADGDANLAAVALKEASEETGIEGLVVDPRPIDLDIHRFRAKGEPDHDHLDVRFLVLARPGAEPTLNHESEGSRWVSFEDLSTMDVDAGVLRMAAEGLSRLRSERG